MRGWGCVCGVCVVLRRRSPREAAVANLLLSLRVLPCLSPGPSHALVHNNSILPPRPPPPQRQLLFDCNARRSNAEAGPATLMPCFCQINLPLVLRLLVLTACACSSYSYAFAWSRVHHPSMRRAFQTSITTTRTSRRRAHQYLRITMGSTSHPPPKKVAVLGAGAAGLVAGRLLRDAGFDVRILEKTSTVGGVWKYRPKDVMYKSLTTNLPKEIMAFHDTPFDPALPSFLGHAQVQEYLEMYTKEHRLEEVLEFETEVKAVRPVRRSSSSSSSSNSGGNGDGKKEKEEVVPWPPGDYTVFKSDEEEDEEEPLWLVTTLQTRSSQQHQQQEHQQPQQQQQQLYDAIIVCNGHFDVPYSPSLPGLTQNYKGQILHSREYDDPEVFSGLKVLCVGYKSSGTDIAREVASVAREVHVVDRRLSKRKEEGGEQGGKEGEALEEEKVSKVKKEEGGKEGGKEGMGLQLGNIYRRPDLLGFVEGGDGKSVKFIDESVCEGVDVVLFCTGYCYSMPFFSGGTPEEETSMSSTSSLPSSPSAGEARLLRIEDRAVFPIYQHFFHAYYPSLVFLGLLHSVVPFPMFELQAKWVVQSLLSSAIASAGAFSSLPSSLPSRRVRFQWLEDEKQRRQQAAAAPAPASAPPFPAPPFPAPAAAPAAAVLGAAAAPAPTEPAAGPATAAAAAAAAAAVGLGRDWFYMGPNQWAYNRLLATHAQCLTPELEQDFIIREEIYNDVSKRRPVFPGGGDGYRRCKYRVKEGKEGWTVEEGEEEKEGQAEGRTPQYL